MKLLTSIVIVALTVAMILTSCGAENADEDKFGIPEMIEDVKEIIENRNEKHKTVPEELREHLFLSARDAGSCRKMTGKIAVLCVLVNDGESEWDGESVRRVKAQYQNELSSLMSEAERYGLELNFSVCYSNAYAEHALAGRDVSDWCGEMLASAGFADYEDAVKQAKERTDADECVPVFHFNKNGRSFAHCANTEKGNELVVLFGTDDDAIDHEVCHVFGTRDYYYPDEVKSSALKLFKECIMVSSKSGTVDPLSAYLMGWTDTVSATAVDFLESTAGITSESLKDAREEETYTGAVVGRRYSNGTYSGDLVFGVMHGEGVFTYDNGDVYEGGWRHGAKDGYGVYTWPSGARYAGQWLDGEYNGEGTYEYVNGTVYTGQWLDGKKNGMGRLTYVGGSYFEGEFADGEKNGHGVHVYENGAVYEGEYKDGEMHGKGKYTFANGASYEGSFVKGVKDGYGVYRYASGAVYSGQWKNGEMHGWGTLTYAGGYTVEGMFENGEFVS